MLIDQSRLGRLDRDVLRARARSAYPFPFVTIDGFLDGHFAREIADAFPSFDVALSLGRTFSTVNERRKVQISDSTLFPPPIRELHELLQSREWLETLSYIMDIPDLMADPELIGGGIHETGPHGRLDVHVDFNYNSARQLHRRLNILLYFNSDWQSGWGGALELWDHTVRAREHVLEPSFNRCVIFATSEISFHGVTALTCPKTVVRKSFAAYYYTRQPPPNWNGKEQPTMFKARPREHFKGHVLMPSERAARRLQETVRGVRRLFRRQSA